MNPKPLKSILHVDDDEDIRIIIRMALETVGSFKVHQFATGREAVDAAEQIDPQLILLDVMMPDMSGQEVWQSIKTKPKLANTPTIFLTAKAEDDFSKNLIATGALAVIKKPIDPMTLAPQIEEIWNKNALS